MDQTLEVRWFYDGSPPQSVVDWFMALDPQQESEREDLYLVAQDPSLNVKLRAGNIQLKRRRAARTLTAFSDRVQGYREPWQKWSFPLTDGAPDPTSDDPSGLWRPVVKVRAQRAYSPKEQRALLASPEEPNPATGFVELTRVRSESHQAWTICIEAEGRMAALPGTLRQLGRYVFHQDHPPALDAQHSYGYARWLTRVYPRAAATDSA